MWRMIQGAEISAWMRDAGRTGEIEPNNPTPEPAPTSGGEHTSRESPTPPNPSDCPPAPRHPSHSHGRSSSQPSPVPPEPPRPTRPPRGPEPSAERFKQRMQKNKDAFALQIAENGSGCSPHSVNCPSPTPTPAHLNGATDSIQDLNALAEHSASMQPLHQRGSTPPQRPVRHPPSDAGGPSSPMVNGHMEARGSGGGSPSLPQGDWGWIRGGATGGGMAASQVGSIVEETAMLRERSSSLQARNEEASRQLHLAEESANHHRALVLILENRGKEREERINELEATLKATEQHLRQSLTHEYSARLLQSQEAWAVEKRALVARAEAGELEARRQRDMLEGELRRELRNREMEKHEAVLDAIGDATERAGALNDQDREHTRGISQAKVAERDAAIKELETEVLRQKNEYLNDTRDIMEVSQSQVRKAEQKALELSVQLDEAKSKAARAEGKAGRKMERIVINFENQIATLKAELENEHELRMRQAVDHASRIDSLLDDLRSNSTQSEAARVRADQAEKEKVEGLVRCEECVNTLTLQLQRSQDTTQLLESKLKEQQLELQQVSAQRDELLRLTGVDLQLERANSMYVLEAASPPSGLGALRPLSPCRPPRAGLPPRAPPKGRHRGGRETSPSTLSTLASLRSFPPPLSTLTTAAFSSTSPTHENPAMNDPVDPSPTAQRPRATRSRSCAPKESGNLLSMASYAEGLAVPGSILDYDEPDSSPEPERKRESGLAHN